MPDDEKGPRATPARPAVLSRRDFAFRAALASAATLAPRNALCLPRGQAAANSLLSPDEPKLSPAGQAEAEARIQMILARYGSRLSAEQKADVRRLSLQLQEPLESLRTYPLANGDPPALYLKPLFEREKRKPSTKAALAPQKP